MKTPITPIRLPKYLKDEINRRKGNKTLTAWVIEAIQKKLKKYR